jgi:hypothetical protein
MIESLVVSILTVEAGLTYHSECDAGDGWSDRSTSVGGRDLRARNFVKLK